MAGKEHSGNSELVMPANDILENSIHQIICGPVGPYWRGGGGGNCARGTGCVFLLFSARYCFESNFCVEC